MALKLIGKKTTKDGIVNLGTTFVGAHQITLPPGTFEIAIEAYTPTGKMSLLNMRHRPGECVGKGMWLNFLFYTMFCFLMNLILHLA